MRLVKKLEKKSQNLVTIMPNINNIKKHFPIFQKNPDLVYLDSAATSLKPQRVVDKLVEYYTDYSANVYRGIYKLSERATEEYEESRKVVAKFINAPKQEEVIFTRNTTESINLVSYALGRKIINEKSEIVVTIAEHHSNFVPWQQLVFENGATLKVIEIDQEGNFKNIDKLEQIINRNTKIFALTYISNVLGVINPIKEMIKKAKEINPDIIILIDGAQAISHLSVDVRDLGCDFFAFSSHKMFGPTGVGVLWGKYELLEDMYPFQYGGDMVAGVTLGETNFKAPPHRYEAGTPHIAGVIALKEAVHFIESLGRDVLRAQEIEMIKYTQEKLRQEFNDEITVFGQGDENKRIGIFAFTLKGVHPHDIAQVLDEENIAIRAGHHCAMPLHHHLNVSATARISLQVYNNKEDIDKLVKGLKKVKQLVKT